MSTLKRTVKLMSSTAPWKLLFTVRTSSLDSTLTFTCHTCPTPNTRWCAHLQDWQADLYVFMTAVFHKDAVNWDADDVQECERRSRVYYLGLEKQRIRSVEEQDKEGLDTESECDTDLTE
jgi:hypothetical protein